MNTLSIIIGKIIILIGKPIGRSSSLPGMIARTINKKIYSSFTLPSTVIAVTGSSGKGSTSSVIADTLRSKGYLVAHNKIGSNLSDGILTLLIENSNIFGKINKDYLVYEIDERYTKAVFDKIKTDYLVVTNITRDQPPRQGHHDIVLNIIKSSIKDNMHLILNGEDAYLQKLVKDKKNKVTYFGIEENIYSYKKNKFNVLNMSYCPICNSSLIYNYYNFENNGDYHCSRCSFKTPTIDFLGNIDYKKNIITINNKYKLKLDSDILYSVYNELAAFTTCAEIGIIKENEDKINTKLFNKYKFNSREVTVLNNKNENSSTFNQSLLYIEKFSDLKVVVIGWKEISRRYNFDDLSWLYDIEFELLNNMNIEKVICVGIHRFDIASRIKIAGIEESKISIFNDLEEITELINNTKGNIYGILNFDYVKPFNEILRGDNK